MKRIMTETGEGRTPATPQEEQGKNRFEGANVQERLKKESP